jgi:hypothetical protein
MSAAVEGFHPPSMPSRVMVRSYRDFPEAEHAVEQLAEEEIPSERITIVARGLRWAEKGIPVRGGAAGGAWLGAVIGLALWAAGWSAADIGPFLMIAFGAVIGVVSGFVVSIVRHFTSLDSGRAVAVHFVVLVDEEVAGDARELLA